MLTDYRTDDTCAAIHVRHATTPRPVGTRARSRHMGTPAHVCTVYGLLVNNLRGPGRYTTTVYTVVLYRPGRIYSDANRTTDSLRRKFALLYWKRAPTGDPRVLSLILRAKKVRQDMTARVDLGGGDNSDSGGSISADEIRIENNELPNNLREPDGDSDVDSRRMPTRSSSSSSITPAFPIVHKRQRRAKHNEYDDLMSIMKASLMQEREFHITERERAGRERRDARERREEEVRTRAYEREGERIRRHAEREEAEEERKETRKNRDAMMQVFMMYITKLHSSNKP